MASRRGYVSDTEVEEMIGGGVDVADLEISEAEELIDAYVGFQDKFCGASLEGRVAVGGTTSNTLESVDQNAYDVDYLKGCVFEVIGGAGAGQRTIISGQTREGVVTFQTALTTTTDTTSFYKIYQLGKFPRICDVTAYSRIAPTTYYKHIPEEVKRAVSAQVEFMREMGDPYFKGEKSQMVSERIGDYSYSKSDGSGRGVDQLIAPKAKELLRGIRNRKGAIIV
jgi:hypothetical protein